MPGKWRLPADRRHRQGRCFARHHTRGRFTPRQLRNAVRLRAYLLRGDPDFHARIIDRDVFAPALVGSGAQAGHDSSRSAVVQTGILEHASEDLIGDLEKTLKVRALQAR
ncbi:hypothetical protein KFL_002390020 [Klebsormidium nitens]|uniref:Uncharacterized protein n=1 Tax=Klebsormidium nitens TaxID=105231 RepID=A0A1Y1IBP2_KLENI|nr:hypothetical protein KFL_002390020 [Klebsormidium nitens]|eukprot:GAQ85508.1 hypothetical protein KFL_002390020 [Klebsormidium nitens]